MAKISNEKLILHIDGFDYYDLYNPEKLGQLTSIFFDEVRSENPVLAEKFSVFRKEKGKGFSPIESSSLLVEMAPYLSAFIAKLFGIENECKKLRIQAEKEKVIFDFKREFFTRRVLKKIKTEQAKSLDIAKLDREISAIKKGIQGILDDDSELETAAMVMELMNAEKPFGGSDPKGATAYFKTLASRLQGEVSLCNIYPISTDEAAMKDFAVTLLSIWEQWAAAHYFAGTRAMKGWVTFKQPEKVDFDHLVERVVINTPVPNMNIGHEEEYRHREGFDLTDLSFTCREAMSEIDYCIICHERGKDSCSKGFHDGSGYKKNPLDYELAGCPLDQKISESHFLQGKGDTIAALSIIAIDNPMCPGTGHRICNDCMKACIYQKQEPVNIPQAETRILTDILSLP